MRLPTALAILAALAGVGLAAASGLLISRAALRPEVFLSLILLVTAVRALGVGRAGLRYAERLSGHDAALRLGVALRLHWFDTVSRFGRDLLALERSGDLLSHAQADVDARQMYLLRTRLPLLAFAGVALGLLAWLSWFDLPLALLATLPLLLAAGGVWQARRPLARLSERRLKLVREHGTLLLDALTGSADGAGRQVGPTLEALGIRIASLSRRETGVTARLTALREGMFAVGVTGVMWRGAVLVEAGTLPGPLLAAVVLATAAAFDSAALLSALPGAGAAWQEAETRQQALSVLRPQVTEAPDAWPLPAGPLEVRLRRVQLKRAGRTVLSDVNLHVPAGERLVITGPSGGGKTTLLRLLTRDLDADSGEVKLGGVQVAALKLSELRRAISLHEQDAPLLDGTLAENLRLADPQAADNRLLDLLSQVGLAHLNLDTWVGEGGTRLSGGERARVSVLRALLAPSRVVLLDEPTAHLDEATEGLVLSAIQTGLRGRTLIIVSHRPGPLRLADRALRLTGGTLSPQSFRPEASTPEPAAAPLVQRTAV